MGKITQTSSDIIPISDSNSENTTTKSSKMPYMSDNTIVPRVQKYLENNVDKTYVDITQMADELQKKYREYAKRKRSAFRTSVQKAYSIVLRSYGLEDISDDALVSDDSDAESDEAEKTQGGNSLNNTLEDLYQRQPSSSTSNKPKLIESELIDISSEDSEEEAAYNVITTKKSNGAVPSTSAQAANNLVDSEKSYVIDILPSSNKQRNRKRKPDDMLMKVQNSIKKKKINNNNDGNELIIGKDEKIMRFKNIGGIDKILKDVYKLLLHIRHPEVYKKIGITPPRGILLHGPPGSGKTLLANAIAGELGIQLIKVAAPELVAGVSGESEERIRDLFDRARNSAPCVLFIDEIDTITPNRQNAQKEMERRIVAQILTCLDDLSLAENGDQVLLIGATNRPDAIDPALRRAGRFDREISLGIPDVKARQEILKILTDKLNLALDFDYEKIAKFTPGYVGADLLSLTTEAAMTAVHRLFNVLEVQKRSMEHAAKAARTTVDVNKAEKVAEIAKINKAEANHKEEAKSVSETSNNEEEVDVGTNKPPDEEKIDETVVVLDDTDELPSTTSESAGIPKEIVKDAAAAAAANNEVDIVVEEEEEEEEPRVAVVQEEQEPMPIDEPKPITDVEELEMLQNWFHDQATINDEALKEFNITMEDFENALKKVQPSAKREGFATVPNTTWDDVGSLKDVRRKLQMAILAPVRHPEQCESLGLIIPTGILLCGPPGCGKTLLAKAIANEAGINFISVKGPELLNMYVGESERAVRTCFERARNSAPCVIFFDELDALCPKRSDSREGGAIMRVVNQMLTEMDGVEGRRGVYLLAASNRPDIIDPAVLRPGRLDKILYVGLPSREDRVDILRAITKNGSQPKMDEDVDLVNIGTSESAKGYTGADLAALVREASVLALEEFMIAGDPNKNLIVSSRHFIAAFEEIRPSVPDKDQKHYEKLRRMYTAVPKEEVEEMEYS